MMNGKDTQTILNILAEEVVPAEGCTEPIALAYVGAKAREILDDEVEKVIIKVSGNMIKNVKSVVVPNSGGMVGIEVSVIMGIIAGDSKKDLMVISSITKEQMEEVKKFLAKKEVKVIHEDTDIKLYANITLESKTKSSSVEIKHMHTNITHIEKNHKVVLDRPCNDVDFNSPAKDREILDIKTIYELAKTIDLSKIEKLLQKL